MNRVNSNNKKNIIPNKSKNKKTNNNNSNCDDNDNYENVTESNNDHDDTTTILNHNNNHQQQVVPYYLSESFYDLFQEDGLICFGKGLQWLLLLGLFVRFYSDNDNDDDDEASYASCMADYEIEHYKERNNNDSNNNTSIPTRSFLLQQYKKPFIIIIGLCEKEYYTLCTILMNWGMSISMLPILINNESGQSKDRYTIYQKCLYTNTNTSSSIICITSRILIVDLLSFVILPHNIDGILVAHSENVTEQSTEAFIIRLYQTQRHFYNDNMNNNITTTSTTATPTASMTTSNDGDNNDTTTNTKSKYYHKLGSGFVKAFTDQPDNLTYGFASLEKILKSLHVMKFYLYPRFHDTIRNELEKMNYKCPNVIEYYQPLSLLQKDIQNAIASAMIKCIRQLRSTIDHLVDDTSKVTKWDDNNELSIENCVTNTYDKALVRQLEPCWHKLTFSTKQLITDIRTLRTLFISLLSYDCVSFYNLLCSIQSMSTVSRYPALWLLDPAADIIYKKAKQRVYTILYQQQKSSNPNPNSTNHDNNIVESPSSDNKHSNTDVVIPVLNPVLEENPKWILLKQVLNEIKDDINKNKNNQGNDDYITMTNDGPTNIIIMVKDDKTVDTIKSYLIGGKKKTILIRWLRYLEIYNRSRNSNTNYSKTTSATTTTNTTTTNNTTTKSSISDENRLLLEEEGRIRRILFGNKKRNINQQRKKQLNEIPDYIRKRRRVNQEKDRGKLVQDQQSSMIDEAMERTEYELMTSTTRDDYDDDDDDVQDTKQSSNHMQGTKKKSYLSHNDDDHVDSDDNDDNDNCPIYYSDNEMRIIIQSYTSLDGEKELLFLQDIKPKYIILYDSDVTFIRAVEVYTAVTTSISNERQQQAMNVYLLTFEASAEEKNFKRTLEREQNAFEKLIELKKTMSPPMLYNSIGMTQEMNWAIQQGNNSEGGGSNAVGTIGGTYMNGTLPLAFDSTTSRRRGGRGMNNAHGTGSQQARRDVVVDVREFRSALPGILHLNGMRLAPVTLIVGDFVITNVHCIERKSISDLYGSFTSGRLYTQVDAMNKHYTCPCLLIEFDPNKSFALQNQKDIGIEIRMDSICTKMALITMHFPKLRLLWSKSPHDTFRIFEALKQNHDEPNVERSIEIGKLESDDDWYQSLLIDNNGTKNSKDKGRKDENDNVANPKDNGDENENDENEEEEVNEVARNMLLRLPGMNPSIARKILQEVDTLYDLCQLSRDELRTIAGPATGQKLFTFFRQSIHNVVSNVTSSSSVPSKR